MDIKFTCLIYSKYSDFSKKLLNIIENSGIDFINIFKIKLLCADNENIRKTILKSKTLDIKNVPCILLVYEDGKIEKYDDLNAFKWVDEIIQKIHQQKQLEQDQIRQQQLQEEQTMQQLEQKQQNQNRQIKPQKAQAQVKQNIKSQKVDNRNKNAQVKNVQVKNIKKTSIDDLDFDDEQNQAEDIEEQENNEYIDNDIIDDENTEDSENEVRKIITNQDNRQQEKPNALTAKRNDLMSLAASMQKSRESIDTKISKKKVIV